MYNIDDNYRERFESVYSKWYVEAMYKYCRIKISKGHNDELHEWLWEDGRSGWSTYGSQTEDHIRLVKEWCEQKTPTNIIGGKLICAG